MNHPLSLAPGFSRVWAGQSNGNRFNGFRSGRPRARWVVMLPLLLLLPGCVVFPHSEVAAPSAKGVIVDAATLTPLTQARVSRSVATQGRHTTAKVDSAGAFQLKQTDFVVWLPSVCYAPTDIRYRVECPGYASFTTNLLGGGSFADGRKPHDLGRIALKEDSR